MSTNLPNKPNTQ